MDTTPEPSAAVDELVKRAERLASGAERRIPSWLRPGDPESRLPVLAALIVAIMLQLLISRNYTLVPRWPLVVLEVLLLVVLVALNPLRLTRSTLLGKYATWVLLGAITVDNTLSAIVLDARIITGGVSNDPALLLGSGAAIFVTNIIGFRHLVLGAGPRRSFRTARRNPAVSRLPIPANGSRHCETREAGLAADVRRLPLREHHQRDGILAHRHHARPPTPCRCRAGRR
jgi:hypothetical protein